MLKKLVTDVKSSLRSNTLWLIFPKSVQIFPVCHAVEKNNLQNKMGWQNLPN